MLDFNELRKDFSGEIVSKDHAHYEELRIVYSANFQKKPESILICRNEADVIAAVKFSKKSGLPVAVRCAGHNGSGLSVCDDGIVIDLSGIKYTRVDSTNDTVRVGAGNIWEEVDKATSAFCRAVPSGIVSLTGVSGLTLGGGHGYITRKHGLTIDSLIEADVVLADGSYITASEDKNSDIFWAIRGGGGNFGIITSFLFKMVPVHDVYCGPMFWDLKDLNKSIVWFDDFIKSTRNDLYGFYLIQTVPPAPPFPEELQLKKICGIMWCYCGPKESYEEAFAPIKKFTSETPPIMDGTHWSTYAELNAAFNGLYPSGDQWYWKGDYFDKITEEVIDIHARNALELPSWKSAMHLYPVNGKAHEVKAENTAWNNRNSAYSMVIAAVDPDPSKFNTLKKWASKYWRELNPYSGSAGGYVNFMMDDEGLDRVKATYGTNYKKLVDIKRKYDPENLFRLNQNIIP